MHTWNMPAGGGAAVEDVRAIRDETFEDYSECLRRPMYSNFITRFILSRRKEKRPHNVSACGRS